MIDQSNDVFYSSFAHNIAKLRYLWDTKDGGKETWAQLAHRVAKNVMGAVDAPKELVAKVEQAIANREFMPGGRYLYAAGRAYHQTNNCFSGETEVVTRFGTKTIRELAAVGHATLQTSGGAWVESEVRSFGRQELLKVTLVRAGAEKTIFATPGHSWRISGSRSEAGRSSQKKEVTTDQLRPGDSMWMVFGYGISRTPVSPAGALHGIVFGDGCAPSEKLGFGSAHIRLCGQKDAELLPLFAGYPTHPVEEDTFVSGLPRHYKNLPSLEFDRSYLLGWLAGYFAADGCVDAEGGPSLASVSRKNLEFAKDVCYLLGIGTYPIRASDRVSNLTGEPSLLYSFKLMKEHLTPEFFLTSSHRIRFQINPPQRHFPVWKVKSVEQTDRVEEVYCAVVPDTHEFVLADHILTGNCLLLRAADSREGWAELAHKAMMALMTGAGIGIVYSDIREKGQPIRKTGGVASGPLSLAKILNETGREVKQGGSRRSAIWAGIHWWHPDAMEFVHAKDWSPEVRALKAKDFNFPASLDMTNVSIILDDDFFEAYKNPKDSKHTLATTIYWEVMRQALKKGEPGFSVDTGENSAFVLRNACTEVTSDTTDDICNIGSINMSRVRDLEHMKELVEVGTAFLLAGSVYSDVPYPDVDKVRTKNRLLGLGLMGLHEWLLTHGKPYGPDPELEQYLQIYATSTDVAGRYAKSWRLSKPKRTRAVAPNGTTGITAETTGGCEPVFTVAYKRRYYKGTVVHYEYVVDPVARRLINNGIKPENIEDAYTLAENVERRVEFQAWLQKFVDHGISSTVNLPPWGTQNNNDETVRPIGNMLMKYLPKLRGITFYPDGARDGQPLNVVSYQTAVGKTGKVFVEEQADVCSIANRGSCGA
jgi:ribonucleoside-diphosphate reductase alpha chain